MVQSKRAMDISGPFAGLRRRNEWTSLGLWMLVLAAGTGWALVDNTGQVKIGSVGAIVILLSSLALTKKSFAVMLMAVVAAIVLVLATQGVHKSTLSWSGVSIVSVAAGVTWLQVLRRDRLGLKQIPAEVVIGMIRDRLETQAKLPLIPDGWFIEVERRAADGAAISGDFVATRLVREANTEILHLAIFDVSGSGIAAGPPALLLSGAVGGLLGTVAPDDFLRACNDYLTRQHWSLGFATGSYIRLDTATGLYEVRTAGHPPALHFRSGPEFHGAKRWRDSIASGALLGVLPVLSSKADGDRLAPGDALIAYTDGLVEARTRDLDEGIGRLKLQVESLAERDGWSGAAALLIEQVPIGHEDDRTVVVLRRAAMTPGLVSPSPSQSRSALTSVQRSESSARQR